MGALARADVGAGSTRSGAVSGGHRNAWSSVWEGVIQPRVRPLSSAATASRSCWEKGARSLRLGKYWRSSPLVLSLEPRCHGLGGSQVDGDTGGDAEAGVGCHLLALVPGERAGELFGQRGDVSGQGVGDDVGAVTVGQLDEHHESAVALDEWRWRSCASTRFTTSTRRPTRSTVLVQHEKAARRYATRHELPSGTDTHLPDCAGDVLSCSPCWRSELGEAWRGATPGRATGGRSDRARGRFGRGGFGP
jgi:hypothetical protein